MIRAGPELAGVEGPAQERLEVEEGKEVLRHASRRDARGLLQSGEGHTHRSDERHLIEGAATFMQVSKIGR